MTTNLLGERVPQRSWWYGVHHLTRQNKYSNVQHWDLLCNQTAVTEQRYRQDTRMAPIMSITIGVFVSTPDNPDMVTTTTRPHKENLKISTIKSIKSVPRKDHGCVVVIT